MENFSFVTRLFILIEFKIISLRFEFLTIHTRPDLFTLLLNQRDGRDGSSGIEL